VEPNGPGEGHAIRTDPPERASISAHTSGLFEKRREEGGTEKRKGGAGGVRERKKGKINSGGGWGGPEGKIETKRGKSGRGGQKKKRSKKKPAHFPRNWRLISGIVRGIKVFQVTGMGGLGTGELNRLCQKTG